jgi:hypothetical protein
MASDLSERHDAEGRPVEPVSAMDRHSAALMALERTAAKAGCLPTVASARRAGGHRLSPLAGRRRRQNLAGVRIISTPGNRAAVNVEGLGASEIVLAVVEVDAVGSQRGFVLDEQAKRLSALRFAMNVVGQCR